MKRILFKTILLVSVVIILSIAISSIKPVVTNEVAMGQMENSDALFVAHEAYNRIAPIVELIPTVIAIIGGAIIGNDAVKYHKNKEKNVK